MMLRFSSVHSLGLGDILVSSDQIIAVVEEFHVAENTKCAVARLLCYGGYHFLVDDTERNAQDRVLAAQGDFRNGESERTT